MTAGPSIAAMTFSFSLPAHGAQCSNSYPKTGLSKRAHEILDALDGTQGLADGSDAGSQSYVGLRLRRMRNDRGA